jgi:hypothetical protein
MEALATPVIKKITARYGAGVHAGNMIFTHYLGRVLTQCFFILDYTTYPVV